MRFPEAPAHLRLRRENGMIAVDLSRIIQSDRQDPQYIYLKEKEGDRAFPIVIGRFEADEIERKVSNKRAARPMTHDLIHAILAALGAHIEQIVVDDLRDSTFHAKLYLRLTEGQGKAIDCRPSDAIALASAVRAPIFVEEHVMNQVAKSENPDEEGFF